ncbi:ScbR family autoregulator-binding transcription factor [Streptomyces sp. 4N509B]|uniref:ScbR family autoregulator-binding transcription factor n=1 Tax=Streptomyces sp. 4N509B TaxID=3457413 RepID=UPI003FD6A5EE
MQERALRTRRRVLRAAATVFDREGFSSASIADILKAARVTKGALYFHFESKEALARGVMEEQKRSLVLTNTGLHTQTVIDVTQGVARQLGTDPVLRASFRLTAEQRAMGGADPSLYLWWHEVCRTHLVQAAQAGELTPDTEPGDCAHLVVGCFTGIHLLSQVLCEGADLVSRLAILWRALLPAIAREQVLPRLNPHGSGDLLAALQGSGRDEEAAAGVSRGFRG